MADPERNTFGILLVVVGGIFVLILAWAIFTLVGNRETVDPEGAEHRIPTEEDAALDELEGRLDIVEYRFDDATRQVEGSVINETEYPVVNVQVEFVIFGLEGDSLTAVRDTTSEVAPRETWQFSINVPGEDPVGEVRPGRVSGAQRQVTGPQATSPTRQPRQTEPVNR